MRRSSMPLLSTFILVAAASRAFSATTVPTTLSGTWSGTAKAVSYSSTATKAQRSSPTLTFVFSQTGPTLSVQTTIVTADKSTLTGTLTGIYGNGNFWILGVTSNANQSQSLIFTGHATSKGIKGVAIGFNNTDDAEVTYALKPSSSAQIAASLDSAISSLCGSGKTSAGSRAAVNVTGKASGKVYTISTTGKSAPLHSAVTGSSTNSVTTQAAVLTLADSTGSQTFVLNGPVIGNSLVISGPNSANTSQAVFSLHTAKTTAKGVGILYNNGALVELKLSLKQQ